MSEVHYEIFRRVGAKGGWTLHDVNSRRESALEIAKQLMADEKGHRREGRQRDL